MKLSFTKLFLEIFSFSFFFLSSTDSSEFIKFLFDFTLKIHRDIDLLNSHLLIIISYDSRRRKHEETSYFFRTFFLSKRHRRKFLSVDGKTTNNPTNKFHHLDTYHVLFKYTRNPLELQIARHYKRNNRIIVNCRS